MKAEYKTDNGTWQFNIGIYLGEPGIDIVCYYAGLNKAWLQPIINGKIVWRDGADEFLNLTPEIIEFAEKLVKNKAFI
jgi:hypothetical protein